MRDHDTQPASRSEQLTIYRRMPPGERVALAFAMTEDAWRVTADGIRARHPEYDDATLTAALRRVVLGDALFHAAWPDAPLVAP